MAVAFTKADFDSHHDGRIQDQNSILFPLEKYKNASLVSQSFIVHMYYACMRRNAMVTPGKGNNNNNNNKRRNLQITFQRNVTTCMHGPMHAYVWTMRDARYFLFAEKIFSTLSRKHTDVQTEHAGLQKRTQQTNLPRAIVVYANVHRTLWHALAKTKFLHLCTYIGTRNIF